MIERLHSHGRKVGSLMDKPESQTLGQNLFDLADKLENRQRLFDKLRSQNALVLLSTLLTPEDRASLDGPRLHRLGNRRGFGDPWDRAPA